MIEAQGFVFGQPPSPEQGITYGAIADRELRITLRAGEVVRLTAQMCKSFQRHLASQGKSLTEIFGSGEESGLNLDFIVDRLVAAGNPGWAIKILEGTLWRVNNDHQLKSDKGGVICSLELKTEELRRQLISS